MKKKTGLGTEMMRWIGVCVVNLSPIRQDGYVVGEYIGQKTINDNEK